MRAVFLDRDGVLNEAIVRNNKPFAPRNLSELVIIEGVPEALVELKSAGFKLIVVTNQPDVARGAANRSEIEAINHHLMAELPLDAIGVCWHDDADSCICRKPKPGLILEAASKYDIVLENSYMVGDRWKDIDAGKQAGCQTVWIKQAYDEKKPEADFTVLSLIEAAELIREGKQSC